MRAWLASCWRSSSRSRRPLRRRRSRRHARRFRYETVSPGRYPGRPPHLHVKIGAPGHRTLVTQLYPQDGQRAIATDLVLVAE